MKLRYSLALAALAAVAGAGYAQEPAAPEAAPAPKEGAPEHAAVAGDYHGYQSACGGCYGAGCDLCCEPCCEDRCGKWLGGVGFYYLKPHWKANPAFVLHNEVQVVDDRATQFDFSWDHEVAPLIWLGYMNADGLGVRVRYWQFDHGVTRSLLNDDEGFEIQAASGGSLGGLDEVEAEFEDTLRAESTLDFRVADFEGIVELKSCGYSAIAAVGVRYVHMRQSYLGQDIEPEGIVDESVEIHHGFKGFGPTVAFEVRKPFGCYLAAYGSARYSFLYGDARWSAEYLDFDDETGEVEGDETANAVINEWDDFLHVGELELGAEFSRNMGCRQMFVQVALVTQAWFGAGNASNNESLLGDPDDPEEVIDHDIHMGMFGLKVAGGLRY